MANFGENNYFALRCKTINTKKSSTRRNIGERGEINNNENEDNLFNLFLLTHLSNNTIINKNKWSEAGEINDNLI